jgi:hypothetical protein
LRAEISAHRLPESVESLLSAVRPLPFDEGSGIDLKSGIENEFHFHFQLGRLIRDFAA